MHDIITELTYGGKSGLLAVGPHFFAALVRALQRERGGERLFRYSMLIETVQYSM